MAIGEGYVAALGTVVVAALAIGAAVGTHSLVGDTTLAASPSASPSVTVTATVTASDQVCQLMTELVAYFDEKTPELGLFTGTLDLSAADDPATLDALHASGQAMLDYVSTFVEHQNQAAVLITDPALAEAFRSAATYMTSQGDAVASVALGAASVDAFTTAAVESMFTSDYKATAATGWLAGDAITEYVQTECGVDLTAALGSDGTPAGERIAKADVATIGVGFAFSFIGWNSGDPLPSVSTRKDSYYLGETNIGPVTDGIEIADQYATAWDHWCAAVTYTGEPSVTFRYSYANGVEEGTCAALAAGA